MTELLNERSFILFFDKMQEIVHDIAKQKGWWEGERNDGELIALMHSELSEGLEALRKDLQSDHITDYKGIEEELADCIIRIMDMAEVRGYNISGAIVQKIKFNTTREYKHGKKF